MLGLGVLPLSKLALATLFGLGLTVVLFLGPLVQSYLDDDLPFHSFWHDALLVSRGAASLPYLRDYIVAPVAEEIVFRGCMVPIWRHLAQISPSMTIVLLPLIFGLSHFHHVPETRAQLGGRLAPALVRGAFQCIYTTVFGMFATWLMLKTSSVWPCVASHMLCNMMGLPQVGAIFGSERRRFTQFFLMSAHIVGLFLFGFLVARFNTSPDIPYFVD
ncbi:Abi-domain-containing protein [Ramicandelaber brevisporus]|nr:Abi-domain-containing protein [Ramicandelaber brevisporus]